MKFVDFLKSVEKKSRFEKFLLKNAEEQNLVSDVDFENFLSKFAFDALKTSDTYVIDVLYFALYEKFLVVYLRYLKAKTDHLLAVEKIAGGA